MSALDVYGAVAGAPAARRDFRRRGHLSSRTCVTASWSRRPARAAGERKSGDAASTGTDASASVSFRSTGLLAASRRGVAGRRVACRASPRERQRKEEDLKRYLREKGVDVPRTKKTTFSPSGESQDPFVVVDEAIERDGLRSLRLLDLDTVRQRWDVPWGGWRVFFGIGGWSASFVLTAALIFPLLLLANGVDPRDFDANQQSKYLVEVQLIETVETFAVLWLLLRKFAPEMEGGDWFKMDFADDPFSIEKGWLTWGLIGYVAVFFSIGLTATAIDLGTHAVEAIASGANQGGIGNGAGEGARAVAAAAADAAASSSASSAAASAKDQGPGTIDAVLPMLKGGEGQTGRFFSILTVTSVLAPLLEEVVFRGFLLASLTKWLPTPGAVVFSSVVFGAAHLAPRDFPQLVTLGIVLGFSYARTRNLLTPMFIHSLWNSGVLIVVAALVATGNESALPGIAGGGQ
jgi:hypothetical protein